VPFSRPERISCIIFSFFPRERGKCYSRDHISRQESKISVVLTMTFIVTTETREKPKEPSLMDNLDVVWNLVLSDLPEALDS
jgi:hypothetical protein